MHLFTGMHEACWVDLHPLKIHARKFMPLDFSSACLRSDLHLVLAAARCAARSASHRDLLEGLVRQIDEHLLEAVDRHVLKAKMSISAQA